MHHIFKCSVYLQYANRFLINFFISFKALQPCRVEMSADMPVQLASDLKAFINAASIADLISISRSSVGMEPQATVILEADGSSKVSHF